MLHSNDLLTLDELAETICINKSSVVRKRGLSEYFVKHYSEGKGRPISLYSRDVLSLWGRETSMQQNATISNNREIRSDRNKPRKPSGASDAVKIELDESIKKLTYDFYMRQPKSKMDIKQCVSDAVYTYIQSNGAIEGFGTDRLNPIEHMIDYYYKKRIMNPGNNSFFNGYFIEENWEHEHILKWGKKEFQRRIVNNRWEYLELFHDLDLIGRNHGAGDLWFIDGTGFKAWVSLRGKKTLINYMVVFCALTGYPMHVLPVRSESAETVIRLISETYAMYGVPRYGFVLDNSSAFKSQAVQGFIQGLYSQEHIEEFSKANHWSHKIFGDQQKTMLWFPKAFIPTFPFKAKGERAIGEISKYMSRQLPMSWQADQQHKSEYSLASQTMLMRNARTAEDSWRGFINWMYSEYINQINNSALKHYSKLAKESGLTGTATLPTPANAFEYFRNDERLDAPAENAPVIYYWCTPPERTRIHRITVRHYGSLGAVQHENVQRNYVCDKLEAGFYGKKVAVIPLKDNPKKAHLYLEYDAKSPDRRAPEPGAIYYIGLAHDNTVRAEADLYDLHHRRRIQSKIESDLQDRSEPIETPIRYETKFPAMPENSPAPLPDNDLMIPDPADDIHENSGFISTDDDDFEDDALLL